MLKYDFDSELVNVFDFCEELRKLYWNVLIINVVIVSSNLYLNWFVGIKLERLSERSEHFLT